MFLEGLIIVLTGRNYKDKGEKLSLFLSIAYTQTIVCLYANGRASIAKQLCAYTQFETLSKIDYLRNECEVNNGGKVIHVWTDEEKADALAFYKEIRDDNPALGNLIETLDLEPSF